MTDRQMADRHASTGFAQASTAHIFVRQCIFLIMSVFAHTIICAIQFKHNLIYCAGFSSSLLIDQPFVYFRQKAEEMCLSCFISSFASSLSFSQPCPPVSAAC